MILLPQYISCQNENLNQRSNFDPFFFSFFVQDITVVNFKANHFPFCDNRLTQIQFTPSPYCYCYRKLQCTDAQVQPSLSKGLSPPLLSS